MSKEENIRRVLMALGKTHETELTPEQEQLLKQALYPEEQFYADVEKLFNKEDVV